MSDLISRKALINYINDNIDGEGELGKDIRKTFSGMIEMQPTAYDVDKVVAQINGLYQTITYSGVLVNKDDVVSILKGGLKDEYEKE